MATLIIDKGTYRIQWLDGNKRQSVSLSCKKFSRKTATDLSDIIVELLYCKNNSIIVQNKRTVTWIESANPLIKQKLAKVGLIPQTNKHTCDELWDAFLNNKTSIKQSTQTCYKEARRYFYSFFDPKTIIATITKSQIEQWKSHVVVKHKLAEATIAGVMKKVSAVFNWAIKSEWLQSNPMTGVPKGSFVNHAKDRFISIEEYERWMRLTDDQEWRVILSLVRIGGLRCPSEVAALKWDDIDWENNRFYVTSEKTANISGHEGRVVPLFPRLRLELEKWRQVSGEDVSHVVVRTGSGIRCYFLSVMVKNNIIIQRPFDNMRASRSTEIFSKFGEYLESKWVGHSTKIACKHYLQVREEDYEQAVSIKNFV
ncbi:MAG: site-specific integrase [Planctomycetaceae bacterium]|jgi:integrase|nr:site-specific integrase [Planctomycetaceae bacterium]